MQIENFNPDEDELITDAVEDEDEAEELADEDVEGQEDDATDEDQDDGEDDEESSLVAVEINGREYEVPEELVPAIMKNKDYTTKTQALAEERKALEAEREAFKAQAQRDAEDLKLDAELFQVENALEQYKNVDWGTLEQNDPDSANSHFRQMQLLRQRYQDLAVSKQERLQAKSQEAQQNVAKRIEETEAYAVKNIPNWSDGMAEKLYQHALDLGYDQNSVRSNLSPNFIKLLNNSYKAAQIEKRAATPKKAAKANIRPLRRVAAKAGAATRIDLSTADMETYAKARQRGVGG